MTNEQAIIELRDLISDDRTERENEALLLAIEKLRDKRPQGEWIETEWQTEIFDTLFKCSICEGQSIEVGDYCPWCGAKMKGGEEE